MLTDRDAAVVEIDVSPAQAQISFLRAPESSASVNNAADWGPASFAAARNERASSSRSTLRPFAASHDFVGFGRQSTCDATFAVTSFFLQGRLQRRRDDRVMQTQRAAFVRREAVAVIPLDVRRRELLQRDRADSAGVTCAE